MAKRPDLVKRNIENTKHGKTGSRTYRIWKGIKYRCENSDSKDWHNYGGRGIFMCKEWSLDFRVFLSEMGEAPPGMQIDRINNDDGYYKANCRWVTVQENADNRRTSVPLTYKGETKPMKQFAIEYGIEYKTLAYRIRSGWSVERALTTKSLIPRKEN